MIQFLRAPCVLLLLAGCVGGELPSDADAGSGLLPGVGGLPSKPPPSAKPPGAPPPPDDEAPAPGDKPGAPPPGGAPEGGDCGAVDERGTCDGDIARWCQNGQLRSVDCAAVGEGCGWVNDQVGYYCGGESDGPGGAPFPPDAPDPAPPPDAPPPDAPPPDAPPPAAGGCGNLDYHGRCVGAVAEWCDGNVVRRLDCAQYGQGCGWIDDQVGYYCGGGADPGGAPPPPADQPGAPPPPADQPGAPPPPDDPGAPLPPDQPGAPPPGDGCGGLDYLGTCEGDVAVWCADGRLHRADCATRGESCGWINDQVGYYCQPAGVAPPEPEPEPEPGCGDVDFLGRCDGDVAVWCDAGAVHQVDCAERGQVCGYIDPQVGWFCR